MAILVETDYSDLDYKQSVAPDNPARGLTWLDTSGSPWTTKFYNGTEWKIIKTIYAYGAGQNNGYICGGYDGTNKIATIDRILFPFDSGTASNVGNLTGTRYYTSACDGTDFVNLFN